MDFRFAHRTDWDLEGNELTLGLRRALASGRNVVDLTRSNPTVCGFEYGDGISDPMQQAVSAAYEPSAFGDLAARQSVGHYYTDHGARIAASRICLTTSTSEGYSYLFRLLCNPGDEILIAQPSYPLFEYLAQLSDVVLREYPLHYDPNADAAQGWTIDLEAVEARITARCRAIVLVHPNNPTGNFTSPAERHAVEEMCVRHGLALIVDEVFLDYALATHSAESFTMRPSPCLCFVLSGISKVCALPQMKVSWIVTSGPDDIASEAVARLEMIADTFLSMNLPVQLALPGWLDGRHRIQSQIMERVRVNLAALDRRFAGTEAQRLEMQGGWTVIVRVPRTVDGRAFAMVALERGVLVQPGELYGLPEGRIVLSLLTPLEDWELGLARLPV